MSDARKQGPTLEEHLGWYKGYLESGNRKEFCVCLNNNSEAIGTIGLSHIDYVNKDAEYGVMIGLMEHLGKGYAQEASYLIIQYGFEVLNLQRIWLEVLLDNRPAINLYQRLGFEREIVLENAVFKDGVYKDVLVMAIKP